jgi:hypothetical protein
MADFLQPILIDLAMISVPRLRRVPRARAGAQQPGSSTYKEITMKSALTTLVLALSLAAGSALAGEAPAKVLTPQQQKMKGCNVEAKGKHGDERRAFMSTCLKGGSAKSAKAAADAPAKPAADAATTPAKPLAQQASRKTCSADAKAHQLKGAARKSFIGACVKGEQTASVV